jgi:ribonuclease-3
MSQPLDFAEFEKRIGVTFSDRALLRQAFTHRSYLNENRSEGGIGHNERLEFLGDAVLELVVTDYLYGRYPDKDEGDLTSYRSALVNTNTLSQTSSELNVNAYLLLSRGEAKDVGRARQYILANAFEAITGAIYLDQGYDAARDFISRFLLPKIDMIIIEGAFIDAKSKFQEMSQDKMSVTPAYKTLRESGPDHDKRFEVGAYIGENLIASGQGKSKQDAEQEAARAALKAKGWL